MSIKGYDISWRVTIYILAIWLFKCGCSKLIYLFLLLICEAFRLLMYPNYLHVSTALAMVIAKPLGDGISPSLIHLSPLQKNFV